MVDEPDMHDQEFWERFLERRNVACPGCRYNLRGARSPICPECQHIATLRELQLTIDPTGEQWYTSGAWAITAAALLGFVPGVILLGASLGRIFELGAQTFIATRSDALILLGVSVVAVIGLPLGALAWRRYVHVIARGPGFLRWASVGVFTALALAMGMLLLSVVAALGLAFAG